MDPAAHHFYFILGAYGVVTIVVAALVGWVVLDGRRLAGQIARLEAQGVRRRAGAATGADPRRK